MAFGTRRTCLIGLALLTALLLGCDGRSSQDLVTRTDSAGVEIVFSSGPGTTGDLGWELSEQALARIGDDEDPRYLLDRVGRPFRLSEGEIVVPNRISLRLRVYSETGKFVRDIGGEGEGPGELMDLANAWRVRGDSLAAFDYRKVWISYWDSEGAFARRVTVRPPSYL